MINDVARKLRRLRKQAGLSQADVAKELDLTVTGLLENLLLHLPRRKS